jgi:hypothetical protein
VPSTLKREHGEKWSKLTPFAVFAGLNFELSVYAVPPRLPSIDLAVATGD